MKTKTQYLILQGYSNTDSSLLIKFDGDYSYWGSRSQTWIRDPTLLNQNLIDGKFKRITEREVKIFMKEGAPVKSAYRRVNPKLDGILL